MRATINIYIEKHLRANALMYDFHLHDKHINSDVYYIIRIYKILIRSRFSYNRIWFILLKWNITFNSFNLFNFCWVYWRFKSNSVQFSFLTLFKSILFNCISFTKNEQSNYYYSVSNPSMSLAQVFLYNMSFDLFNNMFLFYGVIALNNSHISHKIQSI